MRAYTDAPMPECPDDNLLIRMAHGGVSGDGLAKLEAHLDGCPGCRTLVAAVAGGSAEADPRAPVQVLNTGEVMGRYTIERLLGAGGMGVLYVARDTRLDRRVALKLMRPHYADELGRARLLREAQAMARLSHPNVVNVFDLGEVDDRVFVAMEFVEGGTLRDWLKTPRRVEEILSLFLQAGEGLLAAHRAGIVHRDFKPENVLIGADGRARVTDFGLARPGEFLEQPVKRLATGPVDLTQTGTVLGTPAYMSPEQLQLEPADARSDQYSFCVSLYEALEGRRPFEGRVLDEVRTKVLEGSPPRPARDDVTASLWRTLQRGMALRPGGRFASMEALLAALKEENHRAARPWLPLAVAGAVALAGLALLISRSGSDSPAPMPVSTPAGPQPLLLGSLMGGPAQPQASGTPPPTMQLRGMLGPPSPTPAPSPSVVVEEVSEPAVPEPLPADGLEIDLEPSQSRTFDVTGSTKVVIANPHIADVLVEDTALTLGGLELGKTTLSVTRGGRTHAFPVRVRTAVMAPPQRLSLVAGAQRELNVPGLTRIALGDVSVVDVRTTGDGRVLFRAGLPGKTNVFVWTRDARRFEYGVEVTPAVTDASVPLRVGIQQVVGFRDTLTHVSTDDPNVCEVQVLGDHDHELLLIPLKPGITTLQVWMGNEHETRALVVRPAPDLLR